MDCQKCVQPAKMGGKAVQDEYAPEAMAHCDWKSIPKSLKKNNIFWYVPIRNSHTDGEARASALTQTQALSRLAILYIFL